MVIKRLLFVLSVFLFLGACSNKNVGFDIIGNNLENNDLKKMTTDIQLKCSNNLDCWIEYARENNQQLLISLVLYKGLFVYHPDYQKSIDWNADLPRAKEELLDYIDRANSKNKDIALVNLAVILLKQGSDSIGKATKYLTKACLEYNNARACLYLGVLYHYGVNGISSYSLAEYWYKKSIFLGNVYASYNLGLLYDKEYEDPKKAEVYYLISANQGYDNALLNLASIYVRYPDLFIDPYSKAIELYNKSAELDNSKALYNLASFYEKGFHIDKDIDKALKLYEKSAMLGNVDAQLRLANLYFSDKSVKNNYIKSYTWLLIYRTSNNTQNSVTLDNIMRYHLSEEEADKAHKNKQIILTKIAGNKFVLERRKLKRIDESVSLLNKLVEK